MKNRLYLISLLTLITVVSFAQSSDSGTVSVAEISESSGELIASDTRYGARTGKGEISYEAALIEYKKYEGSPFLYEKEILVDLILHNDSLVKNQLIHYDLFGEETIVKMKKGENIVLNQAYYKGFNYKHEGVEEQFRRLNPAKPMKFYKVLFQNDDFVFCSLDKISITKATRYIPGQAAIIERFTKVKNSYIVVGRKAKKVTLKKGALIQHLPEKYQAQVDVLKKKLKLKKLNKQKDYLTLMKAFE